MWRGERKLGEICFREREVLERWGGEIEAEGRDHADDTLLSSYVL